MNLPHKHSRGGQSAARFGRLADEARAAYVSRAAETLIATLFPPLDAAGVPSPAALSPIALVVVGAAETKTRLVDCLPSRLRALVVAVEDVPYGGDAGFAIGCRLAEDSMAGSKLAGERAAVAALEEEIALDRGRYVLGEAAVVAAIEAGAAARVLVGVDAAEGGGHRVLKADDVIAIAAAHGASGGTVLVSPRTPEGSRFCRGLTGIAAILRWTWAPPEEGDGARAASPEHSSGADDAGSHPTFAEAAAVISRRDGDEVDFM